jgi:uncharacterized protein (TIRG00374 family)
VWPLPQQQQEARNKRRVGLGFTGLGDALVMLGLSLWADAPKLLTTLGSFRWELLPIVLAMTVWNYLLRFIKWQYYLGLIKANNIKWRDSLLVFLSGFSMTLTPAKVGELLKSFLLKEVNGTPISASAPIIIAERLSDGVALLFLALFGMAGLIAVSPSGLSLPPYTQEALIVVFIGAVAVVVVVQWRALALWCLHLGERLPLISRRFDALERFYESSFVLLQGRSLLLAILIGIFSWIGECFALFIIMWGLGAEPSLGLFTQSTFVLAAATVIASVSGLPGGLAVAEGLIAVLLLSLGATNDQTVAAGATLLIRASTLWFGVILGAIGLFVFTRRMQTFSLSDSALGAPATEVTEHSAQEKV